MKIKVNTDACIGCGACYNSEEELFEMTDDGLSKAKVEEVPEDKKQAALDAIAGCPTGAITGE